MAQRTPGPIPKPDYNPGVVYRTAKQDVTTLQEQMCLEDDAKTFLEFIVHHGNEFSLLYTGCEAVTPSLMKQKMANHLDIGMGYKRQDPGLLEEVREEVLVQCPALEERYIDARPITSYLRLALRQRTPLEAHQKPTLGRKSRSKHSQTNDHGSTVSRRSRLGSLVQKKSTSTDSSSKRSLRRSTRLTKKDGNILKPTNDDEGDQLEDEEDATSFESQKAGNADHEVGSDSALDPEGSPPLRFNCGLLGPDCTSKTGGNDRQGAREDLPSNCLRLARHMPPRTRRLSPDFGPRTAFLAPNADGMNNTALKTKYLGDGLVFFSPPLASRASTSQPSDIENMLLSCGLPVTDSRRIARLLSSLGIVDKAYLRVFARLAPSREMWLSEMRRKGQLSEVQAWVVVDMLDTVVMD